MSKRISLAVAVGSLALIASGFAAIPASAATSTDSPVKEIKHTKTVTFNNYSKNISGSKYTVLQGGTVDPSGYVYVAVKMSSTQSSKDKVRILKSKYKVNSKNFKGTLSSSTYWKASAEKSGTHANDMTYVPDFDGKGQDRLLVADHSGGTKIWVVNPTTLKWLRTITLPKVGGTQLDSSGICYSRNGSNPYLVVGAMRTWAVFTAADVQLTKENPSAADIKAKDSTRFKNGVKLVTGADQGFNSYFTKSGGAPGQGIDCSGSYLYLTRSIGAKTGSEKRNEIYKYSLAGVVENGKVIGNTGKVELTLRLNSQAKYYSSKKNLSAKAEELEFIFHYSDVFYVGINRNASSSDFLAKIPVN
jgi:hypothetical protein